MAWFPMPPTTYPLLAKMPSPVSLIQVEGVEGGCSPSLVSNLVSLFPDRYSSVHIGAETGIQYLIS